MSYLNNDRAPQSAEYSCPGVILRDETLRDGMQGQVTTSAALALSHILKSVTVAGQIALGWPYANLSDGALLEFLRTELTKLQAVEPRLSRDLFFIYTLVHLGPQVSIDWIDKSTHFGKLISDLKTGTQPYSTVNILAKARVADLHDFGEGVTAAAFRGHVINTMKLLHQANPEVHLELALEHLYYAWLEPDNQCANRKHIVRMIADYLVALPAQHLPFALITAPDTDGALQPDDVTRVIRELTKALQVDQQLKRAGIVFTPKYLTAHMHDDLGFAAMNTAAAIYCGVGAVDANFGPFGERRGNLRASRLFAELKDPCATDWQRYENALAVYLGVRIDDNPVGSAAAFTASGGMHAARLWHAFNEQRRYGVTYREFTGFYNGSYGTVTPGQFGQRLQVTLSPVAGASNVLFMLAGLGVGDVDKRDPRIEAVLRTVKEFEFQRGICYRGFNNTNALLLLADTFGLRDHDVFAGYTSRARNNLKYTFSAIEVYDSGPLYQGRLRMQPDLVGAEPLAGCFTSGLCAEGISQGFFGEVDYEAMLRRCLGDIPESEQADLETLRQLYLERVIDMTVANEQLLAAGRYLKVHVDTRFGSIEVCETRRYRVTPGSLRVIDDPRHPEPENTGVGIKIFFRLPDVPDVFQANGAGRTYDEAMSEAIFTALDYQLFRLEQGQLALGQSPIFMTTRQQPRQRLPETTGGATDLKRVLLNTSN
jgi:isopropylmalate/homocitrate/citramalate synthase